LFIVGKENMGNNGEHSENIEKYLKLSNTEGVGAVAFGRLLKRFASVDEVLGATARSLANVGGIGAVTAEKICRSRDSFDAQGEIKQADELGVKLIHIDDSRYPVLLRRIYDPPPVLYVRGQLSRADNLSVAIVGSRRCSIYGSEQASRFAHLLGSAGFTIVSGMARGIDSAAHRGALSAEGRTVAVYGTGLGRIFPAENKELAKMISESGACVSELGMNYEARAENFPARNRIISGMSLATIVIEASLRSGALITAKSAVDQNREVMAVPGKIDSPLSTGCHLLIKQGARLVDRVEDVVEALGYITENIQGHVSNEARLAADQVDGSLFSADMLNLNEAERAVYEVFGPEPVHVDEVMEEMDLSAGKINAAVISLRLKGLIRQHPGNMFSRKKILKEN